MPNLDRLIRRWVPSLSRLTYNPVFKALATIADLPGRLLFREFRDLPPNYMRIRVGVANRLFSNQVSHFAGARFFWMYALAIGWCRLDSQVLDIGCGCGRFATHLRDLTFQGARFEGKYYGVDIDAEMLAWCRGAFDGRFEFLEATDPSSSYNRPPEGGAPFRIPLPNSTLNFVFSTSLFTHLLERELRNYVAESYRLLQPGGVAVHSCFCLDYPPPTLGTRHTFSHHLGAAHVESLDQPEAAVAYSEQFLLGVARDAGFESAEFLSAPSDWQPVLVLTKASEHSGATE